MPRSKAENESSASISGAAFDEAFALPTLSSERQAWLLGPLLKANSRAFFLTLRVLPSGMREPVALAYLLARAADTIADTRLLPPQDRLRHLLAFRQQIQGPAQCSELQRIAQALSTKLDQATPAEKELLEHLPEAFACLERLTPEDRSEVRGIVVTLTQGMEQDLRIFPAEDSGLVVALPDVSAQEQYTYYVAGCVGAFWTRMTVRHVAALRAWDVERLSALGIRFGKALQYTNILRDVPKDLRISRCYFPEEELSRCDLQPGDLLKPQVARQARPALRAGLRRALEHYRAAEAYLQEIPRRCIRLRLAVLWPVLIGLGTLRALAAAPNWLDPQVRIKVNRGWVYRMLLGSLLRIVSKRLVHRAIARELKGLEAALDGDR